MIILDLIKRVCQLPVTNKQQRSLRYPITYTRRRRAIIYTYQFSQFYFPNTYFIQASAISCAPATEG